MDERQRADGGIFVLALAGCLIVAMFLVLSVVGLSFVAYQSTRAQMQEQAARKQAEQAARDREAAADHKENP
jgi:CHASE3 domain sensor protein